MSPARTVELSPGRSSWVEIRETRSPVGTTGSYPDISRYFAIGEFTIRCPEFRTMFRQLFSRPCGTFQWCMQTQDYVPQALTYLGCFSSNLPQNRHPERSASRIYRVVQRWARSRRTSWGAYSSHAVGTLSTTEARIWRTGHGSKIRHGLGDGR